MVDFKWILIALLQFTAAAEGLPPSFTVRAGQEVTLPCGNVIDDQKNCNSTTWLFSYSSQRATVALIELGQIKFNQIDKSKSDRLSVRQKCSLVIKKVTHEDAGRYDCQQWKSRQGPSYLYVVYLSVVTMTEHKNTDQVEWSCSVSTFEGWCRRTVKWLYNGNNVDEYNKDVQTSQSLCSASVTFQSSHFIHTSNSDLLKCEVTDGDKVQLFPFRLQPSGLLRFIIVSVGLAALIIIVVAVSMWTRTKGRKTQTDENMVADDEDDGAVNYENVTSSV
ncbi:uncharacterized protein LOC104939811 isoform X5 [Larimichthys crocea]|uniref:uncharacterized protein LOC104939811 isoform X5 n=1 Tax=Larimichthys crocea TaxID=215358 RepID=UPI000F5EFBB0|nr:uncharacterized protein LOC104939811 isoform X5 [Larimichthys crocea]